MLSRLNVNDLTQTGLQVKVVYMIPLELSKQEFRKTKALIKNVACENWCEASNAILKHEQLAPEIHSAVRKVISRELSDYLKSDGMLLARNPEEIAGFSNRLFLEEERIHCPMWLNCVLGASGLTSLGEAAGEPLVVNSVALATAALARA